MLLREVLIMFFLHIRSALLGNETIDTKRAFINIDIRFIYTHFTKIYKGI